ncbi:MAG: amidase [Acidobacteria bacterium]|nr:amidase [Acidobacteriota bacterium]
MNDELTTISTTRLAELLRRREVSPFEVVEAYLKRNERLNPDLNAVVTLAPDALERAREAEAAIMRGVTTGALCGVPLTVKDTIDVRALRATGGSKAHAEYIPGADAPAVARLRAAGAVILGKTNASEMALDYTTDNLVFGRTNNPFDLSRTPGGSSGGCAAAVGARLSAGSLGSDLAGSIRIPAHFCGVAGLKPTAGRVPGAGHFPPLSGAYALGASLGPLARSVEDLSLFFRVLSGETAGHKHEMWSVSPLESDASPRNSRVAYYTDDGVLPAGEESKRAVVRAASALRDAGFRVSEERPPCVEKATEMWLALFSHATRRIVYGTYAGREEDAGAAARAVLARSEKQVAPTLEDFLDAWEERDRLRSILLSWMETTPLVLAPVGALTSFRHDAGRHFAGGEKVFGLFQAFSYAQAFNVFDLPAVCVPAGSTDEGLPVGVQIVGRPFEEWRVLAAARVVEEALGGCRPVPEPLSIAGANPI